MDSKTAYRKTPAGEEAVRHRTRLMQRNLRMVLILVDGISSVESIAKKTGDHLLTENAIRELEKAGLIEPCLESSGVFNEGKRRILATGAAALQKAAGVTSLKRGGGERGSAELFEVVPPVVPVSVHEPLAAPQSLSEIESPKINGPDSTRETTQSAIEPAPPPVELIRPTDKKKLALSATEKPAPSQQDPISEASVFSHFPAEFGSTATRSVTDKPEERLSSPAELKESSKTQEPFGKPLFQQSEQTGTDLSDLRAVRESRTMLRRWIFRLVFVLLFGLITAAALFPYDRFRPAIQDWLALATGREVSLRDVRAVFSPSFSVVLKDVSVEEGKAGLQIKEIVLHPQWMSLLSSAKVFDRVVFVGLELSSESFEVFKPALGRLAVADASLQIKQLAFEQVAIVFPGGRLDELRGLIHADAVKPVAKLYSEDQRLRIELDLGSTRGDKRPFVLEANDWRPFSGQAGVIDSLTMTGLFESRRIDVKAFELRSLAGVMKGRAVVEGEGRPPIVTGMVSFERINATRLTEVLGHAPIIQGEVAGDARFIIRLDKEGGLLSSIEAEGGISSRRGSLRNIDLVEAVRGISGAPVRGGATQFEQLDSRFKLKQRSVQFSDIQLASGLMQSRGFLDVSEGGKISGRFEVQMRGSANQSRVPVSISGSLKTPVTQATRRDK